VDENRGSVRTSLEPAIFYISNTEVKPKKEEFERGRKKNVGNVEGKSNNTTGGVRRENERGVPCPEKR